MTDVSWLRDLADRATPGPWKTGKSWHTIQGLRKQEVVAPGGGDLGNSWFGPDDARLIALAPDLARLLADTATGLESLLEWAERFRGGDPSLNPEEWYVNSEYARNALARLAALNPEQQTEEGTA